MNYQTSEKCSSTTEQSLTDRLAQVVSNAPFMTTGTQVLEWTFDVTYSTASPAGSVVTRYKLSHTKRG
jgi:hypothetical protein